MGAKREPRKTARREEETRGEERRRQWGGNRVSHWFLCSSTVAFESCPALFALSIVCSTYDWASLHASLTLHKHTEPVRPVTLHSATGTSRVQMHRVPPFKEKEGPTLTRRHSTCCHDVKLYTQKTTQHDHIRKTFSEHVYLQWHHAAEASPPSGPAALATWSNCFAALASFKSTEQASTVSPGPRFRDTTRRASLPNYGAVGSGCTWAKMCLAIASRNSIEVDALCFALALAVESRQFADADPGAPSLHSHQIARLSPRLSFLASVLLLGCIAACSFPHVFVGCPLSENSVSSSTGTVALLNHSAGKFDGSQNLRWKKPRRAVSTA